MDESALVPSLLYVLLTATLVAWAVWSVEWVRFSVVTAAVVAVGLLFECGLAYEGLRRTMRY